MTAMIWFLLGLWAGCTAGILLSACGAVAGEGERRAESALKKLRGNASRVGARDRRGGSNPIRPKTAPLPA